MLLREVDDELVNTLKDEIERKGWAKFTLTAGVGRCGEHSNLSYLVIRQMMNDNPAIKAMYWKFSASKR